MYEDRTSRNFNTNADEADDYADRPQLDAAWDAVYDIVGDTFSEAEIVDALRKENYAPEPTVARLLDARSKQAAREEATRLKLEAAVGAKAATTSAKAKPATTSSGKPGKAAAKAQKLAELEASFIWRRPQVNKWQLCYWRR